MPTDNTTLNAGSGGETIPSRSDAAGLNWPGGLAAFTASGSAPGNWVNTYVDPTHGLPVHQQTGATWAVSLASCPLPTGAATAANQASELTALALLHTDLTSTLTVGVSGSVAVTGTFWQATQPVSAASLPLPAGASTAANQSTGNTSLASIDGKTPALGRRSRRPACPWYSPRHN